MIELNLVPDVKLQLIRAHKMRSVVISGAIIITIAAVSLVVLLALYVFGAQTVRDTLAEQSIKAKFTELSKEKDLANMVTIQNQLEKLSDAHSSKLMTSRTLDVLSTIVPEAPNEVAVSRVSLDSEENTMTIEAQAANGYEAYEVFKKTILATTISFTPENESEAMTELLASDFVEGDRSYADDADGNKVLRFTISFTYNENLYLHSSKKLSINGPTRTNATDSNVAVPDSLFTNRATDGGDE